ncbi:MAG: PIN domain-containing protein [Desulfosporosinus sp.]
MKVYLDVCCLNRPFDDQTQDKIRIESDAIIAILAKCASGEWQLLSSEVLDIEIDKTPDKWKQNKVYELYKLAKDRIMLNNTIIKRATEIQISGVKAFDSLHLASAEYAKADVFLTTDKNLLHMARRVKLDVTTANPLNWFMEVDEDE